MAARTVIVTGGDTVYFPLMRELIASLRAKPESSDVGLAVLDCGLARDEADWCRNQGAVVVEPDWDIAVGPNLKVPGSFRAMTARPFLRRYVPGFQAYVWLDADVWIQDWRAIALLVEGTRLGDIALVPEVHRSYRNFRDGRDDFEEANGRAYTEAFGFEVSRRLIRRPLNNAGVFAIDAMSPAWDLWASLLADAATRSANMIDQIALNVAIYDHALKEVRLPATCNWIAHLATPAWHEEKRAFVEPDPPYETISILHMTLGTKWASSIDVPVIGGSSPRALRTLRYQG